MSDEAAGPGTARDSGRPPRRATTEMRTWLRFTKAAGVVILGWVVVGAAPFLMADWLPRGDVDRISTFGQTFQVAESFFSALSVAGVAYALVLQAREQADSRRQATRDRHRSDRSDARTARLTLLAALVEARAALVRTTQAAHEEAVRQGDGGDVPAGGPEGGPSDGLKNLNKIRRDELGELLALIHYAERVSGWARRKVDHFPTPIGGDDVPAMPPLFEPERPPAGDRPGGPPATGFDLGGGIG